MPYIATFTDWVMFFTDDTLADAETRFYAWVPSPLLSTRSQLKWQSFCKQECL